MGQPKVGIIILNWNGIKDTVECLESLKKITYNNYNIYVVDNGSTDGSIEYLNKYNTYIKIISNKQNLGFAEGNNIGIRAAIEDGADYVLLLNNDTVVDVNFLTELVKCSIVDKTIAIAQPKTLNYYNLKLESTGNRMDIFGFSRGRGLYEEDSGQYDNLLYGKFFYACGCCILITRDLILDLGINIFDSAYFAYFEDIDLSWSTRLLGYNIIYCPTSICMHKGSKTAVRLKSKTMLYMVYKNHLRTLIKNYSIINILIITPIPIIIYFATSLAFTIYKKDMEYIIFFLKSLSWNIKNIKDTLETRKIIQSKRKQSDCYIMKFMDIYPLEIYKISMYLNVIFKNKHS